MSISPKTRAAQRCFAIHEILLRDWDPIGVREIPEAQDEYDGYIAGVYRLVVGSASKANIVDHLRHTEKVNMGLPATDNTRLATVAEKLLKLRDMWA